MRADGTDTSGLGTKGSGTQTVNVSGDVYRLASATSHTPEPVTFVNRHVGDAASQVLTLGNNATADGFSENLNASIGGATTGITSAGSFSLLAAGSNDSTNLSVGLNTATAGQDRKSVA